jgi:type IV secretory pathway VirB2 component (pilin)
MKLRSSIPFHVFFGIFVMFFNINVFAADGKTASGLDVKDCTTAQNCNTNQQYPTCVPLVSEAASYCMALGSYEFCKKDVDCPSIAASKCMTDKNSSSPLTDTSKFGVCGSGRVTAESNPLGGVLCNALGLVTGQVGRGVVAVAVIVLGFMFFLGKIPWTTVIAVGVGAGAIFGAKVIVGLITGQALQC